MLMKRTITHRPHMRTLRLQSLRVLSAAAACAALAGCAADRVVTNSIVTSADYRERHPIALAEGITSVDIFAAGGVIDIDSARRIRTFADQYKTVGNGPINIQIPQGTANGAHARNLVDGIRRELVRGGARGYVNVGSYEVTNPALASPVRLSFVGLKAQVTKRCGEWPRDIASGGGFSGMANEPYWNHGCATQNALAAQIADPRDLAGPRGETPSDVVMRTRAITAVREGKDPSTQWNVQSTNIGSAGGN